LIELALLSREAFAVHQVLSLFLLQRGRIRRKKNKKREKAIHHGDYYALPRSGISAGWAHWGSPGPLVPARLIWARQEPPGPLGAFDWWVDEGPPIKYMTIIKRCVLVGLKGC